MNIFASLELLPLWGVFIVTLVITLLSVEAGYRWADYREHRALKDSEAPVGGMVGAILGLLAFILGISFSIATDAFHARKEAVVHEASEIQSAHRLARLLPEKDCTQIQQLLKEYVHERLRWTHTEKQGSETTGEVLLNRIWDHAITGAAANPGSVDTFLDSLNNVAQLRAERLNLRERSRIPVAYKAALIVLAIIAHGAMGYHGGVAGTTRSPVMLLVAIGFSLVILIIADLDRPGEGLVNVSQQAMVDLRDFLESTKP